MPIFNGTAKDDKITIINPGNYTLDLMAGTDTVNWGTSERSSYTIYQGPDGVVRIDSISGASQSLNASLYSVEKMTFDSGRDTFDVLMAFPNAVNKRILGTNAADTLSTSPENDAINGTEGVDTVRFSGKSSEYSITFDTLSSNFTIRDTIGSRDGIDRVTAIELLQFSDGTKQIATTDALLVGRLNQALFGKALGSAAFTDSLTKAGPNGNTLEWVKTQASGLSSLSDSAFATLVLKNLSITNASLFATPTFGTPQQAYDALHSAMTGYLGLVGNASRGVVAAQLANIIAGFEGETVYGVYGGAAKAFNQQVGSNIAHSINSSNTSDIVVVPVMATGSSTATGNNFSYMLAMGNYGYQISDFGVGDKIVGPAGVTATLSNLNATDGSASLQYNYNGQTVSITLVGLTSAQDSALSGVTAFNALFGAGALG